MNELIPFGISDDTIPIKIYSSVALVSDSLIVKFKIQDANSIIKHEVSTPKRRHDLWNSTCFEAFFGVSGRADYWELNFTMGGSWNLYYFRDYRKNFDTQGPSLERRVEEIQIDCSKKSEISATIPLKNLEIIGKKLDVGLTSVIELNSSEKYYYALAHIGQKPDFHQRETFKCSLV